MQYVCVCVCVCVGWRVSKVNIAYEHMTKKSREIDPDARMNKSVNQLNSLWNQFWKELKRINESKTSGKGVDETYTHKFVVLWRCVTYGRPETLKKQCQ